MPQSDKIRRWQRLGLCSLLCLSVHTFAITQTSTPPTTTQPSPTPAAKAKHPTSGHTTTKHSSSHTSAHASSQKNKSIHGKKLARTRGQQAIDSARARQIQTALIREHYMQGEPSGTWDSATQAAMQRYQADQGWQSKTTPDSRALIKLGLGPSSDHLLNPESAMTAAPAASDPKATTKQTPGADNLPKN
jgi:hypothetical protein